MAPFYVGLVHIVPQEQHVLSVCKAFKSTVNAGGGLVRKINNSGRRPLPTKMRSQMTEGKQKFANIVTIEFVSNPKCAVNTLHTIRQLESCMRMTLLREDDLLLCRPPRHGPEPKGCIQDWTPKGEETPSPELLQRRSQHEFELGLKMRKLRLNHLPLYESDLFLPEDWEKELARRYGSQQHGGESEDVVELKSDEDGEGKTELLDGGGETEEDLSIPKSKRSQKGKMTDKKPKPKKAKKK